MITAMLLAAATGAVIAETDALANVREGRMICSNPDDVAKTCTAISRYELQADGSLRETSEILLSPAQSMTFEVELPATVKGDAICGTLLQSNLQQGIIRIEGKPLPTSQSETVLAMIGEKMAPLFGRQACETLRLEGGKLLKFGQMEGIDDTLPPKSVRWITADQMFKVAPAS